MNQKLICALLATTLSMAIHGMEPTTKERSNRIEDKKFPRHYMEPCETCTTPCTHLCRQCRLIFYCSEECLKQDGDNHAEYCKFIKKLVELKNSKEQLQTTEQPEKKYRERMEKLKKFRKKTIYPIYNED